MLSGQAQFGLDWLPNLFATREKGGKIVSIAQVFARSGMTELTWKDSGINTIAKMSGKKVGVWCCGNQPELFAALNKNSINPAKSSDVTIVNQPFDMNLFLQRKIDAAAAMTYNELAQVLETKNPKTGKLYTARPTSTSSRWRARGRHRHARGQHLHDREVPEDPVEQDDDRQLPRRRRSRAGSTAATTSTECTNIVLKNGTALGHGHQLWQMNEINKLVWPNSYGIGHVSTAQVASTAKIAKTYGVIKKLPTGAVKYSLADQAPRPAEEGGRQHLRQELQADHGQVTEGGK